MADRLFAEPMVEMRWQAWLEELRRHRSTRVLQWDELEAELADHVRSDVADDGGVEALDRALERLGDPSDIAAAWRDEAGELPQGRASRLTEQGVEAGGKLVSAFALTVALLLLLLGAVALFNPDVGLWVYPEGSFSISFEAQPGADQVGRGWLAPLLGLSGLILIVFALRRG